MKIPARLVISCFAACLANAAEPELRIDLGGGVGLDLIGVRAGEFTQGSPETEPGRTADEVQRPVRITRDYYIARTAVTRGQWERFVAETNHRSEAEVGTSGGFGWDGNAMVQKPSFTWRRPGFPQTSDHPVCIVTFPDAEAFCKWVERKSQRKTTLPTEAQWEYACRAGTDTPWHTGSSAADCDRAAWHKGNSGNGTWPVDSKTPNNWGLVMGGNVSEWCLDWYAPYQAGPVVDPRQDNPNLSDKPRRVLRGGSWIRDPKNTRSAARYRADPRSRNADIGFRIVCATEVAATPPPRPVAAPVTPKVETEPQVPPAPAPSQHQESPSDVPHPPVSKWPSLLSGFGGLLCLLIPIGLIIVFIRLITAQARKSSNPFVVQPTTRTNRPSVRKVDDGFWIQGEWPVGTPLKLRYVIEGEPTMMDVIYRPGPEGQFIFTGTKPDSVSVVADGHDPLPPPLFAQQSVLPDRYEESRPIATPPPIFPSAY